MQIDMLYLNDLRFIGQWLVDSHPGFTKEIQDISFQQYASTALAAAQSQIKLAGESDSAAAVLQRFMVGFQDQHMRIKWRVDKAYHCAKYTAVVMRESIFILDHESKQYDELLEINDLPVETFLKNYIYPYVDSRTIGSRKERVIQYLFTWALPRLSVFPDHLMIRDANGQNSKRRLLWQQFDASIQPVVTAPFCLVREANDLAWITIQRLWTYTANESQCFDLLCEQLAQLPSTCRIVLDVRGNAGGNTYLGRIILAAIHGRYAVEEVNAGVKFAPALWRASQRNVDQLATYIQMLSSAGVDEKSQQTIVAFERLHQGLRDAKRAGRECFVENGELESPLPSHLPKFRKQLAPVFILTDSRCMSSCLNLIAEAVRLGAIHIGTETDADTHYSENAIVELPSGHGSLICPMAYKPNPYRKSNESLRPRIPYGGNIRDTAAIKNWVLRLRP